MKPVKKFERKKIITLFIAAVFISIICTGCPGLEGPQGPPGEDGSSNVTIVPDEYENIQDAIDSLPDEGGTVYIKAQLYTISRGIHINKSNITILGETGTCITLADHVNQPVILVGTDESTPSSSINTIKISTIEIDGNKDNQDSELDPERTWIRNNGIDIRMVDDLYVENVDVHDARSGGIVASWDCHRIVINRSLFYNNFFDGIALYASEDIIVSDFFCYNNDAAGVSLDNELLFVSFSHGLIKNNGDVGIFARNSEDVHFHDLTIYSNASDGCFLSHESIGTDTGVKRLFFDSCAFLDNGRWGLWLASTPADSPGNTVVACLFSGNTSGNINDPESALDLAGNVYQ